MFSRLALRTPARALTTSAARGKSMTETVKETADAINKKVGKTLASGLDSAEAAATSAKETVSSNTPSGKQVEQGAESARQTANHKLGEAAGAARDAKDAVKGEAEKRM